MKDNIKQFAGSIELLGALRLRGDQKNQKQKKKDQESEQCDESTSESPKVTGMM